MARRIFLLCLCTSVGINAHAWSSLYFGAGATYLNIRGTNVSSSTYTGVAPSLYLGYGGWVDEYWHLALEGSAIFQPNNIGSDNDVINLKPKYHYALGLIPAVNLDNTVIAYLRLAAVRASFKDVSQPKNGWEAGIGLEIPLWSNWSVRGEYDYAQFSVNDFGKIQSNQASISLLYRIEPLLSCYSGLLT